MNIGFIGLGDMGQLMAARLLEDNNVAIYNRTKSKAEELLNKGAEWRDSPSAFRESDVIFIMVSDNEACDDVVYGENGLLKLKHEATIINMSTIEPRSSKKLAETLESNGMWYIEAPVSGSLPQAKEGSLVILTSGEENKIEQMKPLLSRLGKRIEYFGAIGKAAEAKLLINSFLAVQTSVIAEFLKLSKNLDLSDAQMLEIINDTALGNGISKFKGNNMLLDQHAPLFRYKHLVKDIRYLNKVFDENQLSAPMIRQAKTVYELGIEEYGELDFSAVSKTYERIH